MISSLLILALLATGSTVNGEHHPSVRLGLLNKLSQALPSRNLLPRDCSAEASRFNVARAAKRGLDSRSIYFGPINVCWTYGFHNLNFSSMPDWALQATCILAPDTPRGDLLAKKV